MAFQKFTNISDDEIIKKIRAGDKDSATYLVEKYTSMVKGIAKKVYIKGVDFEDLIQEGFIGFYEAVKSYHLEGKTSFSKFAYFCIKKNIYDVLRFSTRKKRKAEKEDISLDEEIERFEKESKIRVISSIINKRIINPEDEIVVKYLVKEIVNLLTSLERVILKGYLDGKSNKEMANELKRDEKSIGNALQRARQKIKNYLINEAKN